MQTAPSWSAAEARQILDELEASGLPVAEFARQRKIAAHRLYWARRRARGASKQGGSPTSDAAFREVVVSDEAMRHVGAIEVRLRSGLAIRLGRDFDEVALRRLLGLLTPC